MLCSNLGNEYSDAGHIKWSRRQQVPQLRTVNAGPSFTAPAHHNSIIHDSYKSGLTN